MLVEVLCTLTGVGVSTLGLSKSIPWIKEKHSISHIKDVLTRAIQGENVLSFEDSYDAGYYKRKIYSYKKKNLKIVLKSDVVTTVCDLYDTDINGNTEFFSFTYKTETKELTEVREKSDYYRKRNYYEEYETLFRQFIEKIKEIDWANKEKEEKHWLLAKYTNSPKTREGILYYQQAQSKNLKELPLDLQTLYNQYQQYYLFVSQHKELLELEEKHELERDEEQIQKLLTAYQQLETVHQEVAKVDVVNRMTEKINVLFLKHEKIHRKNLYEFQRISETMKL